MLRDGCEAGHWWRHDDGTLTLSVSRMTADEVTALVEEIKKVKQVTTKERNKNGE